jgi:hypothetical protein
MESKAMFSQVIGIFLGVAVLVGAAVGVMYMATHPAPKREKGVEPANRHSA